jgi:enoyl-CoA hydratase/carnithine racemase
MTTAAVVRLREDRFDGDLVAYVTLDNERKLNVLNSSLAKAFAGLMTRLSRRDDLRAVVLTGAGGRAFVGGADVNEMAELTSPAAARDFIGHIHRCCAAVRDCPAPVVARINGWTLGAGLELAACCDLRVASSTAVFGMPEVKLGIPSVVEAAVLPGLVGWGRTREMLLLGETFDAAAALAMGLVDAVVDPDVLDVAVRIQKSLIRQWEELPMGEAIAAGVTAFGSAYETPEPALAMARWRAARARD